ncbi:MAG: hypothetical protein RBS36_08415 [Thiomicrospira sp.]|jgi:hypothetical protein|nr:hypothetical protein [Thiomicrospira sp.]
MDWQAQDDFLQRWPHLHSLLAAYIAIEEEGVAPAVTQFCAENKASVCQAVAEELAQLMQTPRCWPTAFALAGAQVENQQAWLVRLTSLLTACATL